jgi:hypothetical protein
MENVALIARKRSLAAGQNVQQFAKRGRRWSVARKNVLTIHYIHNTEYANVTKANLFAICKICGFLFKVYHCFFVMFYDGLDFYLIFK